jgi:hypothetical protein
LVCHG